jgi:adenylosuccinate lyase
MKSWESGKDFFKLLKADPDVVKVLPEAELKNLFDYSYYLRFVDEIFERLGLTEAQWKETISRTNSNDLAPRTV